MSRFRLFLLTDQLLLFRDRQRALIEVIIQALSSDGALRSRLYVAFVEERLEVDFETGDVFDGLDLPWTDFWGLLVDWKPLERIGKALWNARKLRLRIMTNNRSRSRRSIGAR